MSPEQHQDLHDALKRMQTQGLDPVLVSTAGSAAEHLYKFVRTHGTAGVLALGLVVGLVTKEARPVTDAFIDDEAAS